MDHPYPNLVWNNEALRQQVLETELEAAKLRLEREKGNCPLCPAKDAELERLRGRLNSVRDECFAAHACTMDQAQELSRLRSQLDEMRICSEGDASRIKELYVLATRWYLADGTFETLPEEEVIRRRKEAAVTLANARALDARMTGEGVGNYLRKEMAYGKPGDAAIIATAMIRYLRGEG